MDRELLEKRWGALKKDRSSWILHWKDLSEYILPRRGRFLVTDKNKGEKINSKIVDSGGTIAARTLASGLMSGISSPSRPWFRLTTPDPELMEFGPVKEWLEVTEQRMRMVFAKSNIYNILHTSYEELGVFGTAPICVVSDPKTIIRAYSYTAGEYALACDERESVNTFYRECSMTVSQMVGMFGRDKCSNAVKSLYDKGSYDETIPVLHVIEPRRSRDITKTNNRNMPIASYYFECGAEKDQFLRESGFNSFPVMAPRWHAQTGDVYGRSPGMDALGDVKQLQLMQKRKMQAIGKLVNPPMKAPLALKNQPTSIIEGAITYVDEVGGEGFKPAYEINPRIGELGQDIYDTRQRINQAFFADLFLMLAQSDRRDITAREIDERHEEKMLVLGPVLERLNDELLDPLIDRSFELCNEAGVIPPAPPEIQGQKLKVDYISILAQAQKAVGVTAIERTAGFVSQMAQFYPDVLDKFDADEAVDQYAAMQGVPVKVVRTDDKVAAVREAKQQQQQTAGAMQAGMMMAEGAKTLSQADTEGKNALTDLMAAANG